MNSGFFGWTNPNRPISAPPNGALSTNLASATSGFTALTTILSLTLTGGTWVAYAGVTLKTASGASNIAAKITDGTNDYGSAGSTTGGANFQQSLMIVSELIVVTGASLTISLAAISQVSAVAQAVTDQGSLTKATWLRALRIA